MPVSMVGRTGELDELVRAWRQVTAGRAAGVRPVVITGTAGIGKSTLVAAALEALTPRPGTVLTGGARLHSPAPYDWLAAALSGRDASGVPILARDLPVPADALAWLAQHPDAPTERYTPGALLRLAVATVRSLVGGAPAVLVVEDLHALDPASLNLIGELATVPDLPALLLVTSQPPEVAVSPRLVARTLARLAGSSGAVRQHLAPLDVDEVAEVLEQVHPRQGDRAAAAREVWERTGGNPYQLVELLATGGGPEPEGLAPGLMSRHPRSAARRTGTGVAARFGEVELTARERDVLTCLAAGMSNKQVARSLGISVRTVTVHVSSLLRKTGTASRTEAALWAVRSRPVDDGRRGSRSGSR